MADTAAVGSVSDADDIPSHPSASLSREQAPLVRSSYAALEPASELVATLFFKRLVQIAPEMEPLLPASDAERRRQLLSSLGHAVSSLDRFGEIVSALRLLGSKFRARGISELHYGAAGEALLWTLKQSLGDQWTSEVADAWTALCTVVAEVMTDAR